jgi:hypothetical protein
MNFNVNLSELFQAIIALGLATYGWFFREIWSSIKDLKADFVGLQTGIPDLYLKRDEFREFRQEFLQVSQRIEDKLDKKVDK